MTHEQLVEEMKPTEEKQAIQSEIAVFWDEIANNLPKSIERSALGDEKIFNAFATAYPKIRHHLLTTTSQRVREERIEEVIQKARADECNAWLDGRRCYECGNEKEVTPLSDTCRQCWETA